MYFFNNINLNLNVLTNLCHGEYSELRSYHRYHQQQQHANIQFSFTARRYA